MSEDCFFYMDTTIPEHLREMKSYCVECFENSGLTHGMFWEGSTRGYGKYPVSCMTCGKKIHMVDDGSKPNKDY